MTSVAERLRKWCRLARERDTGYDGGTFLRSVAWVWSKYDGELLSSGKELGAPTTYRFTDRLWLAGWVRRGYEGGDSRH